MLLKSCIVHLKIMLMIGQGWGKGEKTNVVKYDYFTSF